MRSVLGYAVFVIGLVLAVQAFFPGSLSLGLSLPSSTPAIERSEAPATNVVDGGTLGRLASFSPGDRLAPPAPEHGTGTEVLAFLSSQFAGLQSAVSPVPPPRDVALTPWRSAVVPTSDTLSPADAQAAGLSDGAKRVALIREIQRELKRVGCYDGNVDGSWGGASKRAMVAFIQRVNASLPLNEPNDILLLLVKGQETGTCGVACPLGQTLSRDHRCVPDAILASTERRPAARQSFPQNRVAEATSVAPTAPPASTGLWSQLAENPHERWDLSTRMSIGGPRPTATTVAPRQSSVGTMTGTQSSVAASTLQTPTSEVAYAHAGAANEGAGSGEPGFLPPPVTETAPPAPPPQATRARSSRSAERRERRSDRSRSVQHLFEHPLGRL
jgi:hypothetical protein